MRKMMNIVFIYINTLLIKMNETGVMKRKILELKAHKTAKIFLSNKQSAFKELLINGQIVS